MWSTGEQRTNSDHLPILTEVRDHVIHQPVLGKHAKWRKHGVDLKSFLEEVERAMVGLTECQTIKQRVNHFNRILLGAASENSCSQ